MLGFLYSLKNADLLFGIGAFQFQKNFIKLFALVNFKTGILNQFIAWALVRIFLI